MIFHYKPFDIWVTCPFVFAFVCVIPKFGSSLTLRSRFWFSIAFCTEETLIHQQNRRHCTSYHISYLYWRRLGCGRRGNQIPTREAHKWKRHPSRDARGGKGRDLGEHEEELVEDGQSRDAPSCAGAFFFQAVLAGQLRSLFYPTSPHMHGCWSLHIQLVISWEEMVNCFRSALRKFWRKKGTTLFQNPDAEASFCHRFLWIYQDFMIFDRFKILLRVVWVWKFIGIWRGT